MSSTTNRFGHLIAGEVWKRGGPHAIRDAKIWKEIATEVDLPESKRAKDVFTAYSDATKARFEEEEEVRDAREVVKKYIRASPGGYGAESAKRSLKSPLKAAKAKRRVIPDSSSDDGASEEEETEEESTLRSPKKALAKAQKTAAAGKKAPTEAAAPAKAPPASQPSDTESADEVLASDEEAPAARHRKAGLSSPSAGSKNKGPKVFTDAESHKYAATCNAAIKAILGYNKGPKLVQVRWTNNVVTWVPLTYVKSVALAMWTDFLESHVV